MLEDGTYVWDIQFGFDVICFLQEWKFIPSEVNNVCLIHILLVVDTNPSEKYESISWDYDIPKSQLSGKNEDHVPSHQSGMC